VGRAVSPVLPVHSPEGGRGFDSRARHIILHKTYQPTTGCHVAAHDWATWHINNQSKLPSVNHLCPTCLPLRQMSYTTSPAQSAADVIRAMCHPYSGDTCHPWIGPAVCPYTITCHCHEAATCCLQELPHVICMDCTT
jgi:hypothetical protein